MSTGDPICPVCGLYVSLHKNGMSCKANLINELPTERHVSRATHEQYKELSNHARALVSAVVYTTAPEDTASASAMMHDLIEYIVELEKVNKLRSFFGYHGDLEKEFDAQKKYIKDLETAIEDGKNINISSIDAFTEWWIGLRRKMRAWHSRQP